MRAHRAPIDGSVVVGHALTVRELEIDKAQAPVHLSDIVKFKILMPTAPVVPQTFHHYKSPKQQL
jgi:hypothetical protein